jgi:hypothetical protein
MKLSVLLFSLLPLVVLAKHHSEEDVKKQHERPEEQYIRRAQLSIPQVPIVSCANTALSGW